MADELALTLSERPLAELEAVIQQGLATFLEVGQALLEIRERRLYREQGYSSFDDYTRERWDMTARHANRQIQAAVIIEELGPIGPAPARESVVRELAEVPPEDRPEAWAHVVDEFGPEATAREAREAIQRYLGAEAEGEEEVEAEGEDWEPGDPLDGYPEVRALRVNGEPLSAEVMGEILSNIRLFSGRSEAGWRAIEDPEAMLDLQPVRDLVREGSREVIAILSEAESRRLMKEKGWTGAQLDAALSPMRLRIPAFREEFESAIYRLRDGLGEVALNLDHYLQHHPPAAVWASMDDRAHLNAAKVVRWLLEMEPSLGADDEGET